jgi:hypothetical protein
LHGSQNGKKEITITAVGFAEDCIIQSMVTGSAVGVQKS